jgi:ligand-binding sensor domain-containing protein/signal transduction histidine kinase
LSLKTSIITLLALVCLAAGLSEADSVPTNGAQPSPTQYLHTVWTTENGLPQNSVNSILQTRDGYLWVGTFGGLARFDGVKFTVFDTGNTEGLKSSRISALFEDHEGSLWIGTENGGLARYRDGIFTTYTVKDGLPKDSIASIFEDRQGNLWMGSDSGLVRFTGGKFTTYTTKDGLPDGRVGQITTDQQGNLWVCTPRGLARYQSGKFTIYDTKAGLPSNYVRKVYASRDGSVWAGGANVGLVRFKDEAITVYTTADGLASNYVRFISEDRAGNLWVGTDGGLNRLSAAARDQARRGSAKERAAAFTIYTKQDGLLDELINCFAEDAEGDLWIGTNSSGLVRFKARELTAYGRPEGLPADGVVPITEDAEGAVWIGMTCGGVARFKDGKFTNYEEIEGQKTNCVWSLCADREGNVWIGTWDGGLTRFRDGKFETYTSQNSHLLNNVVLALYQDRGGALWVGTGLGLNRFKDGEFTAAYRQQNGLVHDDVRFITEDREGALWIGTTGGASRFKDGKFTNYTTDNGLSHNFVRAIHQDADGAIWFGTYGGGLNRLKDGKFTRYTTKQGLPENIVSRILEDERGNFWMTGNKGICRVSRKELNDFAEGKTTSITPILYGTADGMRSNECNGGGQPAGWKAHDGKLWFPTAKGVVMIDPQQVGTNSQPPPVAIEQVLINQRAADARQEIKVPPGQSELEIHYTGLSFAVPERVRFKYQLVGLDRNWVDAGTRRAAYYSHLPPGEYTFRVSAANGDGVWNEEGARIRITIIPPFYRTWWFFSLALLGVAGMVILMHRRRVAKLKRAHAAQEAFSRQLIESQERERQRIAAELHDSLGQNLLIIKNRALIGTQTYPDSESAKEQFDEISAVSSQAIDEARAIAYNLRPHQMDRLGLTKAIKVMLRKVGEASEIRFTTEIDDLDGAFPKEMEINLYRIVQESVNNIVKHSAATEAAVVIKRQGRVVQVKIEDNGQGFKLDAERVSERGERGFGLTGIAERAGMLGGQPIIRSTPGQGTTISVTLEKRGERD